MEDLKEKFAEMIILQMESQQKKKKRRKTFSVVTRK